VDSRKFNSNMTIFIESWWTPDGVHQIHQDYLEQGKVYALLGVRVGLWLMAPLFLCSSSHITLEIACIKSNYSENVQVS